MVSVGERLPTVPLCVCSSGDLGRHVDLLRDLPGVEAEVDHRLLLDAEGDAAADAPS